MNVVLSFDDGRSDAYNAFNVVKNHNFKASFHITTGFIDGSFITDAFGCDRLPLRIDQLTTMFHHGMDISCHGDRHIMDNDDFLKSVDKMIEWGLLKRTDRIGFSIPNSNFTLENLNQFVGDNKNLLSYVRVGRSPTCYTLLNKICYIAYHVFHFQCFYNRFNKSNLIKDIDAFNIPSLVVKKDTRVKNLIRFIDKYKNYNLSLVLMFHSIVDNPKDEWEYSLQDFGILCDYLSKNINVLSLKELVEG